MLTSCFVFVFTATALVSSFASAGPLEITPRHDGRIILRPFPGYEFYGNDLVVDEWDAIYVAGYKHRRSVNDYGWFVSKLNEDGQPIQNFAQNGMFELSIPAVARSAVYDKGHLITAGHRNDTKAALVTRQFTDGRLDTGFGNGGLATVELGNNTWLAEATVDDSGRVWLVGTVSYRAFVVRLTSDGHLDPSFADGGKFLDVTPGYQGTLGRTLALAPDGGVFIGAEAYRVSLDLLQSDFAVLKLSPSGQVDPKFGQGGVATAAIGPYTNMVSQMALDSQGRLVVAGTVERVESNAYYGMGVLRLLPDGSLDGSFGNSGKATIVRDFGMIGNALGIDPKDRILLAGYVSHSVTTDFALARLTSAGTVDTSFGEQGVTTFPIYDGRSFSRDRGGLWDQANALTLSSKGKIFTLGTTWLDPQLGYQLALARLSPEGLLDPAGPKEGNGDRFVKTENPP